MKRLVAAVVGAALTVAGATAQAQRKLDVDQGPDWTLADRAAYYSQNQGARIMPLTWFRALKQDNGQPFLTDNLDRYGYLKNNEDPKTDFPVGFTTDGQGADTAIGITCSA